MIDRLQEAELLERRPDSADRRVWRIFLTPKGEEIIGKLQTIGFGLQAELLAVLAPGEQEQLPGILHKLRAAMSKRTANLGETARTQHPSTHPTHETPTPTHSTFSAEPP